MGALADARDILVREERATMPRGAKQQRAGMLAALDALIAGNIAPDAKVPAYEKLKQRFSLRSNIVLCADIVSWVRQTKTLPDISADTLDNALAALEVECHRLLAQPEVKSWLAEVDISALNADDAKNAALMKKDWVEAAGLDEALVREISLAGAASEAAWEIAKPKSDFATWLPHFEKVVSLARKKGEALGKEFSVSPYQALLDSYNPGLSNDTVNRIFTELKAALPPLTAQVMEKQRTEKTPMELPPVPVETQLRICRLLMQKLGLDEQHGRLDKSAHPFSTGDWDDVRVTTRYREDDMLPALMGVVHEVGHAFYSSALPRAWKGQPVGNAQSMWVHESQSLFWEMQVAQSCEFMEFLSALIREELHSNDAAFSADNLYLLATRVSPSFIRVDADEVTYPAHVILRHALEQKLIDGSLAPKDVPAAWAKLMKELLGIDVPDHAHGCMQDVHWVDGTIGYFPAYTFGALGAAQLMQAAKRELPDISGLIRRGDFAPIRAWLGKKIHSQGARYDGEELFERATGEKLTAAAWLSHIRARYL